VRKWQSALRADQRNLDRQVREIQVAEAKIKKSIKEAAKRGDLVNAKIMAKEILQSKKAISRIYTNKAQLMSISNALMEQLALLKVSQTLSKSTEVMKMINSAMKLPELQRNMMEMSREMMKAGLIDEMMGDAMDSTMDTEDMEEETDEEVNRVLAEIAGETLAKLPAAQRTKVAQTAKEEEEEEEEEDEMAGLQARLQAIKS